MKLTKYLESAKTPTELFLWGVLTGASALHVLAILYPELLCSKEERFTGYYDDIEEIANQMVKELDIDAEESPKGEPVVKKTGFEPLRLKSVPDVRFNTPYNKDGTEKEATANGAGWATCADSNRGSDVEKNKEEAVEMCHNWHRSNTPQMAFGNSSGEFTCKVVKDELDSKDGKSRAKACPHIRLVDKKIAD